MELLERDDALGAIGEAYASAGRGQGRAVVVLGEPGIGKTALVTRFVDELGPDVRVLRGTCDDLGTPRPLGPLRDMAPASDGLRSALADGATPYAVHSALLDDLAHGARPTVVLIEDIHWADDATLDAVTVVIRRIGTLPTLLLLTCRDGEAPPGHPIRHAVGSARPGEVTYVTLDPLSREAVAVLAGERADAVYAATRGNPLFVRELLAASGDDLSPTIANAVLSRTTRLPDDAQRLLAVVSVVPNRAPAALLDAVLPGWPAAAAEPERRGLLDVEAQAVHFRHELTRNAVRASLPLAEQRRLHAMILDALVAADADPAEIVHHAEGAGDERAVASFALLAARRAASVESNREALAHYRRAAALLDGRPAEERAAVAEELAEIAYLAGDPTTAVDAVETAVERYEALGDSASVGRCLRLLSRLRWYLEDGEGSRQTAQEAVAVLEGLGPSTELARAQSAVSQLAMLADDDAEALDWGARALALARSLGDRATEAHALVNVGTVHLQLDPDADAMLLEAHALADAAGERHEATRALVNLAFSKMEWARPAEALESAQRGLAYALEHEVFALGPYLETLVAWLRMRAGAWEEAEEGAALQLEQRSVPNLLAHTVLTELAVRRGDHRAAEDLEEAAQRAASTDELQRLWPLVELEIGHALTGGGRMPLERVARIARRAAEIPRFEARALGWIRVAGGDLGTAEIERPAPYAAMARGDWRAAADAFGAIGWVYDRALMLSLLDDEEALVESFLTARALGAAPLARRAAERLRAGGLRVPAGPREATRSNPAGLTARQVEVLALLAEGLTNAEIADRLVVSQRTAEHHVAAVLQKLGVETRRDAARRAVELGLA